MEKKRKTFAVEIVDKNGDGGEITINTGAIDRDSDRVFPNGARVENYLKNPVVQFGHNYRDPWATIGRTDALELSDDAIRARFTLRPAANENDPQNIIRLLWEGDWIRTASIGFMPGGIAGETVENEFGGMDFVSWELLEWSLVPIPANQEALRLAIKSIDQRAFEYWPVTINADQTLQYSPDQKISDIITGYGKTDPARLYVVALPVDADPEIMLLGSNEPESDDESAAESETESINDDPPVEIDGQTTGDNPTTTEPNDEPNNNESAGLNEPNNNETEPDAALVVSLASLTEIIEKIKHSEKIQ